MSVRLRCAIYTRKSSEEGLEQNFNSLHAQREACEAYILSQTGEGWSQLKTHYDDGGFSGGSLVRPGLKRLLEDIGKGHVDVVVVYKVDRLTRSLTDFAKIVELFDAKGVSFVSVTQAFNTTSSMGRLTLNVLLSFAQFEREVTGERIRDKIAASKAKGLRMGGRPLLGYDVVDGKLAVNAAEAGRVRHLFRRYLELGSVADLAATLEREVFTGKRWTSRKGIELGGGTLSRGALYHLLSNPAYLGVTRHKEKRYEGTHPAIIDLALWDAVQGKLTATNASKPAAPRLGEGALLDKLIFDDRGNAMIAVHAKKAAKRYRYYVSKPKITGAGAVGSVSRISAGMIEAFLVERIEPWLAAAWRPDESPSARIRAALIKASIGADEIVLTARTIALRTGGLPKGATADEDGQTTIPVRFQMHRRRGELLIEPEGASAVPSSVPDRALTRALTLALTWARNIEGGAVTTIRDFARDNGITEYYLAKLLPLAFLAPDLVSDILQGRQPRSVTLASLMGRPMPLCWDAQRALLRRPSQS